MRFSWLYSRRVIFMTIKQKHEVEKMRADGCTFNEISMETGVSIGAIKSYFHRKNNKHQCEHCGKILQQSGRKKRFCSDHCRMSWWRSHREVSNKTSSQNCPICHKDFISYPSKHQVYCSKQCAGKARWIHES